MAARQRLSVLAVAVATLGALVAIAPPGHGTAASGDTEVREVFSPDSSITRVRIPKRRPTAEPLGIPSADVVPIHWTGPSNQRLDLVFVGDGYTRDELGKYHDQVVRRWQQLLEVVPFGQLEDRFNVWQVNVVSPESGVDNDPVRGISRNTTLDMGFWCGGLERLLCVDERRAQWYAALAPEVDQVVALGNTTKYGGAGGRVATSSGGNEQAGQIVPHELGHSLGGLADEYDYPNDLYRGTEPREVNVSIHDARTQQERRLKWHRYIGRPSPDGGLVGAFEGAYYHRRGVYRPTENSLMRSLGRPFNLPGRDVMADAILRKADGQRQAGGLPAVAHHGAH
ncbi:hypothetical protein GCM10012275_28950 [Longimycelium tulufanense]|uniref:IgA peptidase M64 n=1 Tax=Longimycelium tulufanense TaxID=907463 RepID=A0A8J3CBU1_9PSEU|nr:M64 family metallopeptidase [Longimycelium tulufanense]GGM56030.1 hypothetical protein GCM10012275_28950 [Longimycelium tulufanense]